MSRYKINYKSSTKINLWVVFVNMVQCFMFGVLFYALLSLALIVFDAEVFDANGVLIPSAVTAAVLSAVGFTVLMLMYARSTKDVEITENEIIIHFGFCEMGRGGYASFHKKVKLSDVHSCTVETEYKRLNVFRFFMLQYDNSAYNSFVNEIVAGQYSQPFVKIKICNEFRDEYLILPAEHAAELCSEINEKICK